MARVTDRTYHTRVEQSFRKVVRHGSNPYDYWWEITDKSGTRFIYGGDPDLNMPSGDAILADPGSSGNIFQWMLREVQDTHGNTMRYHYDVVDGGNGGEPWRQVYLKSIRYTGSGNVEGPYEIVFLREGGRHDVAVDGRPGFKTVLEDRLKSVEVHLLTEANPLIRRYNRRSFPVFQARGPCASASVTTPIGSKTAGRPCSAWGQCCSPHARAGRCRPSLLKPARRYCMSAS